MHASTLAEASALGATKADIDWDFERGFISFPRHEPDLPGHVHCAFELAQRHGVGHALLESKADGEEEILELSRAIYGLKQSSACFFDAMHEHLVAGLRFYPW